MTTELRSALLEWRKERLVQNTIDKEHVFVCLDKTPFCAEYYGRSFRTRHQFMKRLCERACVKHFGFHAIRHLTASILYRKGYSLGHIQAVLRHKNPNTTSQYLRSLGLEQVREALEEGLKVPVNGRNKLSQKWSFKSEPLWKCLGINRIVSNLIPS